MKNELVKLLQAEFDALDAQVIRGYMAGNPLLFARYTALSMLFGEMDRNKAKHTDEALLRAAKSAYSHVNGLFTLPSHMAMALSQLDHIIVTLEKVYEPKAALLQA
jgi:hypothetical protein